MQPEKTKEQHRFRSILISAAAVALIFAAILAALFYRYIVTGGMRARQRTPRLEAFVAERLVKLSIPAEFKTLKSPLPENAKAAQVAAGRSLYQKDCEVCHGSDGKGKTTASSGLYPPPLDLSGAALNKRNRSDGELFYLIRYGIRNTAMPGWQLPDQEIWQLVKYIRNLPLTSASELANASPRKFDAALAQYVGSAACKSCHTSIYDRWIKTAMANVVRDPRQHPDAIIPDFSKSDPLVKFSPAEIALVYGSRWKQRYFMRIGDDYYVFPAQWDVTHKKWRPYFVKDDWWVKFYPPDNMHRPTSALCDGCHSVNYDISRKTVSEWNVGCEKCHGPGSEHVRHPTSENILNSARQEYVAANDVCIQCHSQGRPLANPIAGNYYDWPVGYDVTKRLSDYWKLEDHRLGEISFTHFADGTAHKNRMQGNDYVLSRMYTHGVTCWTCHDAHGTDQPAVLRKPADELCLDCHGPTSPNGPHAPTIEKHTHHKAGSAGSSCVECHMPKIAQTIADVNVRSHTFKFVTPATTESLKTPNACNACHTDKATAWTIETLRTWHDLSPWRMAE
jgi:predicted CXXCH cytochrome family protein